MVIVLNFFEELVVKHLVFFAVLAMLFAGEGLRGDATSELEALFASDLRYNSCRLSLVDDDEFGLVLWVRDDVYNQYGEPMVDVRSPSSYRITKTDGIVEIEATETIAMRTEWGPTGTERKRTLYVKFEEDTRKVTTLNMYIQDYRGGLNALWRVLTGKEPEKKAAITCE